MRIDKLSAMLVVVLLASGFVCADNDECVLGLKPVLEVAGELMPETEDEVKASYVDSEGEPIPVVFKGGAKNWEAAKWSLGYLKEEFGGVEIGGPNGFPYGGPPSERWTPSETVAELVDRIQNSPKDAEYFNQGVTHVPESEMGRCKDACLIDSTNGSEEESCEEPFCFDAEKECKAYCFVKAHLILDETTSFPESSQRSDGGAGCYYNVFIGPKGTEANIHSHDSTFLSQIDGKKRVILMHPKYKEHLRYYTFSGMKCFDDTGGYMPAGLCISRVDFMNDDEVLELAEKAEVFEVVIEPGDILYIPDTWLHHVVSLTGSVSIASGL